MLKDQHITCSECNTLNTVKGNLSTLLVCQNCRAIIGNELQIEIPKKELIDDWSTIKIGTKGKFKEKAFEIIGRIHLQLRRDYKDFWCVWIEQERTYGWLTESFGNYAFCKDTLFDIVDPVDFSLGEKVKLVNSTTVVIDVIDRCDLIAYEGESRGWRDFEDGFEVAQGTTANFFSFFICSKNTKELKFIIGEWVSFADLKLTHIREWDNSIEVKNKITLTCPSCKHLTTPRGKSLTLALTCEACGKYYTNRKWSKQIIQFNETAIPALPLGAKGTIENITYEVMGFTVKYVRKYKYRWREYLLYNPKEGQAYLSEYDGHWNFLKQIPYFEKPKAQSEFLYKNTQFRLYQKFHANIVFAKGEFFTDAFSVAEGTHCEEYIAPPYLLSVEHDGISYRWFEGEYKSKEDVIKAFESNKISLPSKIGRGYTQPVIESFTQQTLIQVCVVAFLAVLSIQLYFNGASKEKIVFEHTFYWQDNKSDQKMFVTPSFYLEGASKSLVIKLTAPISNDWFYGEFTLINEDNNAEYDFSKEIEYYSGVEEGIILSVHVGATATIHPMAINVL